MGAAVPLAERGVAAPQARHRGSRRRSWSRTASCTCPAAVRLPPPLPSPHIPSPPPVPPSLPSPLFSTPPSPPHFPGLKQPGNAARCGPPVRDSPAPGVAAQWGRRRLTSCSGSRPLWGARPRSRPAATAPSFEPQWRGGVGGSVADTAMWTSTSPRLQSLKWGWCALPGTGRCATRGTTPTTATATRRCVSWGLGWLAT
jgi:hypothetical protein